MWQEWQVAAQRVTICASVSHHFGRIAPAVEGMIHLGKWQVEARSQIKAGQFGKPREPWRIMRIIKPSTIREWMKHHPTAKPGLEWWLATVKAAQWKNLAELRHTMPRADQVTTASGRLVVVFNIAGNKFRLIAAVHFNRGLVYALALLTHAEYSKDRWKDTL